MTRLLVLIYCAWWIIFGSHFRTLARDRGSTQIFCEFATICADRLYHFRQHQVHFNRTKHVNAEQRIAYEIQEPTRFHEYATHCRDSSDLRKVLISLLRPWDTFTNDREASREDQRTARRMADMRKPKGLYILAQDSFGLIYGPKEQADIGRLADIYAAPMTREAVMRHPQVLADAEVIFSGWEAPTLNKSFLEAAPNFNAFFYGAGTVEYCLTDAVWERGISVTSAIEANSLPVAEYTLATILFSLKHGWQLARQTREQRCFVDRNGAPGCFGSTVGLVSLGRIARILLKLLEPLDLNVIVFDPFLGQEEAAALGVERVSLEELFHRSDVVSVHTPHTPETIGLLTGEHLASMKPGSTFINTSRGTIVRENELIEVASRRSDLQFVLDVTEPESPVSDSALYTLENVVLTPHIAGSAGGECRRMGRWMVQELERYIAGEPLRWALERQPAWLSASRATEGDQPAERKPGVKVHVNPMVTRKPALVRQK
jgi:phosphoglycerate dehydrogenase-like enzyme